MKINIDAKKSAEAVSGFLQKTSDISKKTLADVQAGAVALSERSKQDSYLRRLRKYNPVFPEVFYSSEFNIPNMIVIVDDAVRRGIDVCEGSIGWLDQKSGMEVLYLYDEIVPSSKLQFIPAAACDAVYFVDSFDRRRFIRVDCIFNKAHEERLAELKYIAHSLGAKKCSIEISETSSEVAVSKKNLSINKKAGVKYELAPHEVVDIQSTDSGSFHYDYSSNEKMQRSGKVNVEFEGSDSPRKPRLKWFAHDENIKRLVDMRMRGDNSVKSETLEISGASSATMSRATACSIDSALVVMKLAEKKSKGNSTMEMQVVRENRSTLIFNIEF